MPKKKQVFEITNYATVSAELLRFVMWVSNTSCNVERSLIRLVQHALQRLVKKTYFIEAPTVALYKFAMEILEEPNRFSSHDYVEALLNAYSVSIETRLEKVKKRIEHAGDITYLKWDCEHIVDSLRIYLRYKKAYSIKFDDMFELTITVNADSKIVVRCKRIEDEVLYFEETFESMDDVFACSTFVGEYCFIMTELNNYLYRGNYIQGRLLTKDHRRYKEIKVMEDPVPLSATHEEQPYFKRHGFL